MGITFDSSKITITDGSYTFEDIYQASVDAGNTYCKKLGTSYLISIDVILGDEDIATVLSGQNISVVIEGDLFQITKGSELRLGTKEANGSTGNGVYLSCPNIKNGYGFGSTHKVDGLTQSGDIYLYASTIDIYGFWGFFGGTEQHCEVLNCNINGYGRIEGPNSIISNVTTTASHGRYGVLAPKGTIAEYKDVKSLKVNEYKGHTCNVYFNPAYAPGMRVIGGIFAGYEEGLVYAEKNGTGVTEAGIITFVDSDIRDGYGGYYSDTKTQVHIRNTFNPTFLDENNNIMSDVQVTIVNDGGAEVFNELVGSGTMSTELLRHTEDKNNSEDFVFYDVTAEKGDISVTRRYRAGVTYKNFPFFVTAGGSGSGGSGDGCSCDDISTAMQEKFEALQTALEAKIDNQKTEIITEVNENQDKIENMSSNVNTMLISLGEEINENQAIIEGKNGARMFL